MEELIRTQKHKDGSLAISARDLYGYFAPTERFNAWISRCLDFGFKIHYDYTPIRTLHPQNRQEIDDFVLSLDCAKQICMIQRNELGTKAREYFIEMEKVAKGEIHKFDVPKTFREALLLAAAQQELIEEQTKLISAQTEFIQEVKPKAEFYDQVTGSSDCFDMGSVAKVCNLGIGRNTLFQFLRDEKILMSNNNPYQQYLDNGYFRVIESKYSKPDGSTHITLKTVVFQKGIDYIIKRYKQKNSK